MSPLPHRPMIPDDGTVVLIANPKSGASSRKQLRRSFYRYLLSEGFDVTLHMTESLADAGSRAAAAKNDPACRVVVVAGGDGTVREVAHGLEGSPKPLLIIPSGTENLLASELGFDEKISTLIQTFRQGHTRPLDLGTINGKCFTCITGFGFDGEVVDRVMHRREGHIDYFDYAGPLWHTFWCHRFKPLHVELDGRSLFSGRGMVFVGNVSRYAMGLQILRHADVGDGLLDICVFKCTRRPHLLKHAMMTIFKHHTRGHDVLYEQGKAITVSSPCRNTKMEVDGDPGPSLPVHIGIIPQAIRVMVPKDGRPAGIRTRLVRAIG